jgi:UV DNA damage repair endonuclease
MSNCCNNEIYVQSKDENNIKYVEDYITKNFCFADLYCDGPDYIEMAFESKWTFPDELMMEMTKDIPNKEDIYIRCMSIELGNYYHELWVFENNEWRSV